MGRMPDDIFFVLANVNTSSRVNRLHHLSKSAIQVNGALPQSWAKSLAHENKTKKHVNCLNITLWSVIHMCRSFLNLKSWETVKRTTMHCSNYVHVIIYAIKKKIFILRFFFKENMYRKAYRIFHCYLLSANANIYAASDFHRLTCWPRTSPQNRKSQTSWSVLLVSGHWIKILKSTLRLTVKAPRPEWQLGKYIFQNDMWAMSASWV